jgi:hypothetical protein
MKALPWILGVIILGLIAVLVFVPGRNSNNTATPAPGASSSTPDSGGDVSGDVPGPRASSTLYAYASSKGKIIHAYVAPNQKITSPFRVEGNVPAGWSFEASFPVQIVESNGNIVLGQAAAAVPNWMSTSTAWFAATVNFNQPATATGYIVLKKDNPSDLAANDDSVRIPVKF